MQTNWRPSKHFKSQSGVTKLFIVDHWMAGYLESTTRMFTTASRRVSTNFGIGQTRIDQYVLEKDYAYGSGTAYANSRGISIEHEGGYPIAGGGLAKPSDAVHELSAQLHADLSRRHKLGRLEVGRNVFPHSHFVATQCPGTLDLQRIVDRANELLGVTAPAPAGKPPATSKPAPAAGTIVVDGIFGKQTIRALQRLLGTKQDGIFGPVTKSLLQRRLAVVTDGYFGPVSVKALQRRLGVTVDGIFGKQTKTALQRRLNTGTI